MDFKPGDTVQLYRTDIDPKLTDPQGVTITRVGRTYAYIEQYGREKPFHIDTGQEKSDYTPRRRLLTPQGRAEVIAAQEADERLQPLIREGIWTWRLTTDQKNRIADILEEKH